MAKSMGKYVPDRAFVTSGTLDPFLKDGGIRFVVQTEDGAHEINDTPRWPAAR